MKTKNLHTLLAVTGILGVAGLSAPAARAQNNTTPNASGRRAVALKDATLRDALELVFVAAGNPDHAVDASAANVRIGSVSFKNQEWRDVVRSLANLNKFRFYRSNNIWIVEPRGNNAGTQPYSSTFGTT